MNTTQTLRLVFDVLPVAEDGYNLIASPSPASYTESERVSVGINWASFAVQITDIGISSFTCNPVALVATKAVSCIGSIISSIVEQYAQGTLGSLATIAGFWNGVKIVVRGAVSSIDCVQIAKGALDLWYIKSVRLIIKGIDHFVPRCESGRDPYLQRFRIYPEEQIMFATRLIQATEGKLTNKQAEALPVLRMVHFKTWGQIPSFFYNHAEMQASIKSAISNNPVYTVWIPNPLTTGILDNASTPCYEKTEVEAWIQNTPGIPPPQWPAALVPLRPEHFIASASRQRDVYRKFIAFSESLRPLLKVYIREISEIGKEIRYYHTRLAEIVT